MAEVEGNSFEKRLVTFLPLLSQCLLLYQESEEEGYSLEDGALATDEQNELMDTESDGAEESGNSLHEVGQPFNEASLDHLLFSTLSTLEKICSSCNVLRALGHRKEMNELWGMFPS